MLLTTAEHIWIVLALALSLIATPLVRALARRVGAVAVPKADRWHRTPTAMMGGVAISFSVLAVCLLALPHTRQNIAILAASSLLWAWGLLDDFLGLKPYQKLIGQILASVIVVAAGLLLPWTPWMPLNMAITIFWLVGITNGLNLLDNMDGLAAGIAAIASAFLAVFFLQHGQSSEALFALIFSAALLGFLVYNSNPASIFMGDCGSMFIGFLLASVALLSPTGGRSRAWLPVLAVPVLVLLIPIFDMAVVTLLRKLAGRAVSRGGRDHTSHRLVALGMSERRAVWLLYALAIVSGLLALAVADLELDVGLAAIAVFTIVLTLLGVYLAGVKVYSEEELRAARDKRLVAFLFDLSHRRRLFEVLLDVMLIILAFYVAHVLLFGPLRTSAAWHQMAQALPALVFIKMATFWGLGVYRGLWRYVSVDSLVLYAKAVLVGSIVSAVALTSILHVEGISPSALVIDGLLLLVLLCGSRIAFRLFRSLLPAHVFARRGRRVLIYGAGDSGALLLHELQNNSHWPYEPVGFLDDDPLKKDKLLHGLPVFGGNGSMSAICRQHDIQEVFISSSKFTPERTQEILDVCRRIGIVLRRLQIRLDTLTEIRHPQPAPLRTEVVYD